MDSFASQDNFLPKVTGNLNNNDGFSGIGDDNNFENAYHDLGNNNKPSFNNPQLVDYGKNNNSFSLGDPNPQSNKQPIPSSLFNKPDFNRLMDPEANIGQSNMNPISNFNQNNNLVSQNVAPGFNLDFGQ